jgi:predicted nucleic acid-binding protein
MEARPDRFTVFVDANALVPVRQRDLILSFAAAGCFRLRWSERVLDEFERALLRVYPEFGAGGARRQREIMEAAFPEALVTGYEQFVSVFSNGPDPDDAHVMAAAKQCDAAVIVTANVKDFPPALIGPAGMEAVGPDDFIADAIDVDQDRAVAVIRRLRTRLNNPAIDPEGLIAQLRRLKLHQTADLLEPLSADI